MHKTELSREHELLSVQNRGGQLSWVHCLGLVWLILAMKGWVWMKTRTHIYRELTMWYATKQR